MISSAVEVADTELRTLACQSRRPNSLPCRGAVSRLFGTSTNEVDLVVNDGGRARYAGCANTAGASSRTTNDQRGTCASSRLGLGSATHPLFESGSSAIEP